MSAWFNKNAKTAASRKSCDQDILKSKYGTDDALFWAKDVLQRDEQSEEAFLGAQGVLILHGLI